MRDHGAVQFSLHKLRAIMCNFAFCVKCIRRAARTQ